MKILEIKFKKYSFFDSNQEKKIQFWFFKFNFLFIILRLQLNCVTYKL